MAGFRLGDWLVEPCKLQISKGGVCGTLQPAHMRLLVCLARRHGEVVDRQTLRECAGAAAALPQRLAIAVLPFVDLTPSAEGVQVGDGLTEEISARLARIPGLRVVPPVAAFEFKGRRFDPRKVGQTLGVQHVLQGKKRRRQLRRSITN